MDKLKAKLEHGLEDVLQGQYARISDMQYPKNMLTGILLNVQRPICRMRTKKPTT